MTNTGHSGTPGDDEDRHVLLCAPVDTPPSCPSLVRRCGVCDGQVWVSREVVPRVDSGWLEVLCLRCGVVEVDVAKPVFGLLPEQVPGLVERGVLDIARQFIRDLNRDR